MSRTLALLVGIETYPLLGSNSQLHGALADVEAIAALLRERAPGLDLRILREAQATREGVRAAWKKLAHDVRTDDEVLFYWAGHGSQVLDTSGDEDDGWDETLVPYDSGRINQPNRDLVDDEVNGWLKQLSTKTSRVSLIVDACHSGTVARSGIRYVPRDPRPREIEGIAASAEPGLAGASGWLPVHDSWVLLASCQDGQLAQELPLGGKTRGVFTWALEQAVREAEPSADWNSLFQHAKDLVVYSTFNAQVPQLEGGGGRNSILAP